MTSGGRQGRTGSGADTQLLELLKSCSSASRAYAIIRHAHREEIPRAERDLPLELTRKLTQQGRADARRFGKELPRFETLSLTSTPVPRARDTASEMLAGFLEVSPRARVIDEGTDPKLGIARFYARDDGARRRLREELGMKPFMQAWIEGKIAQDVLPSVNHVVQDFLRRVLEALEGDRPSTLRIGVSHDFDIVVLRDALFDLGFEEAPWIGYLDGILMQPTTQGSLAVSWGSKRIVVNVDARDETRQG